MRQKRNGPPGQRPVPTPQVPRIDTRGPDCTGIVSLDQLESMFAALLHIQRATGLDGIPSQAERRALAALPERYGAVVRPWWSEVAA